MPLKYFEPSAPGLRAEHNSNHRTRIGVLERNHSGGGGTTIIGGGPSGSAGGELAGSFPNPTIRSTSTPQVAGLRVGTTPVTVSEQAGSLYSNKRVLLNKTAPTHVTGGNRGDGSNIAIQAGVLMDGSYQSSPGNAGVSRITNDVQTSKGSNGVRGQGAGTISSVGTAVTGVGTAFAAGDAGKINAVAISGSAYTYYTAVIAGAPASATSLTLAASFIELRTGAPANVPAGAFYSIDPDRVTLNTPSSGNTKDHFFYPYVGSFIHNTWGSAIALEVSPYINDSTTSYGDAGTGVNGYGELYGLGIHTHAARLGALVGGVETVMTIDAGRQARASGYSIFVNDGSSYGSYSGAFGAFDGGWGNSGVRPLWIENLGSQESGTAIQIFGGASGASFRRVFNYASAGVDYFTMDKYGSIGIGNLPLGNVSGNFYYDARINLHTGGSDAASGIKFGPESTGTINVFRSGANALTVEGSDTGASTVFRIKGQTSRGADLRFIDVATAKWSIRKETDNTFKIEDLVTSKLVLSAATSATGDLRLVGDGGKVMVGTNAAAATTLQVAGNFSITPATGTGYAELTEQTSAVANAIAGKGRLYVKDNAGRSALYIRDDVGESLVGGGGGGAGGDAATLDSLDSTAFALLAGRAGEHYILGTGNPVSYSDSGLQFGDATQPPQLFRAGASVLGLSSTAGAAAVELTEMTAPNAPAATKVRLYAKDDAGRAALYIRDDVGETLLGGGGGGGTDTGIFALLAGRAGGQTLVGGTVASQNLSFQSTAHATRGAVISLDELRANTVFTLLNNQTGFTTTYARPAMYASAFNAGGVYPFNVSAGHLIIQPQVSASTFDIVFTTGSPPSARAAIKGDGGVAFLKVATAPAVLANAAVDFVRENGSGKLQKCTRWPDGSITVLATQP